MVNCCECLCGCDSSAVHDFTVGHGQSEGERVFVDSVDTYVKDVAQHIEEMRRRYPELPCLLMGHSMVSCYVALLAQLM